MSLDSTTVEANTQPRRRRTLKESPAEPAQIRPIRPEVGEESPGPLAGASLLCVGDGGELYQMPAEYDAGDGGGNGAGIALVTGNGKRVRYVASRRAVLTVRYVLAAGAGTRGTPRYFLHATNPDTGRSVSFEVTDKNALDSDTWKALGSIEATQPQSRKDRENLMRAIEALAFDTPHPVHVDVLGWHGGNDGRALSWVLQNGAIDASPESPLYQEHSPFLASDAPAVYRLPEPGTVPGTADAALLVDYLGAFGTNPETPDAVALAALVGTLARVALPLTQRKQNGRLDYMYILIGRTNSGKSAFVNWGLSIFSGAGIDYNTATVVADGGRGQKDSPVALGVKRSRMRYHGYTNTDHNHGPNAGKDYHAQNAELESLLKDVRVGDDRTAEVMRRTGVEDRPQPSGAVITTGEYSPSRFLRDRGAASTEGAAMLFELAAVSNEEYARREALSITLGQRAGEFHRIGMAWVQWLASLGRDGVQSCFLESQIWARDLVDSAQQSGNHTDMLRRMRNNTVEMLAGLAMFATFLAEADAKTGTAPDHIRVLTGGADVSAHVESLCEPLARICIAAADDMAKAHNARRGGLTEGEELATQALDILRDLLVSGKAHIEAAADTYAPALPNGYSPKYAGWRQSSETGGYIPASGSPVIGTLTKDGRYIALDATTTHRALRRADEDMIPGTPELLWKAWADASVIHSRNGGRGHTATVRLGEKTVSRLRLFTDALYPPRDDADENPPDDTGTDTPGGPQANETPKPNHSPMQSTEHATAAQGATQEARQEADWGGGARCPICGNQVPAGRRMLCSEACYRKAVETIGKPPYATGWEPREQQRELAPAPQPEPAPEAVPIPAREPVTESEPVPGASDSDRSRKTAPAAKDKPTQRRHYSWRARAYVNPHTGELVSDGARVRDAEIHERIQAGAQLADILAALPEHVSHVYICGGRPGDGTASALYDWMQSSLTDGWEHGRVTLDASNPVIRVKRGTRLVDLRLIESWFPCESPQLAREALGLFSDTIRTRPAFRETQLLATPSLTGLALFDWVHGGQEAATETYPPLPENVQAIIRANSGQGRIEVTTLPDMETVPNFTHYDGRLMYAALTRELACGLKSHDHEPEFAGYSPARYRVRATVPQNWNHLGLLAAKDDDGKTWTYPATPGQVFETWCDGREYQLAEQQGWHMEILERLIFNTIKEAGVTDPLRSWTENLVWVRGSLDTMPGPAAHLAAAAARSTILFAIGGFASRPRTETVIVPFGGQVPENVIGQPVTDFARKLTFYDVQLPQSPWHLAHAHPEWSAQIWARARSRMLYYRGKDADGNPTETGALTLPRADVLGIRTDALYLANDPQWNDTGRTGALRLKGQIREPVPAPHTDKALNDLRDRAERETKEAQA